MVIFRDPNGHRMVTTPVRRVLGEIGRDTLYVETENSVYRLAFVRTGIDRNIVETSDSSAIKNA
jgi:hypothetical protein